MFSFGLMLALAMLITCLNGQETPIAQSNSVDLLTKKLEDIECRVKQMETMLKKEPTPCIPSLPSGKKASSSIPNGKTASSSLPSGKKASSSIPNGKTASSSLPSGETASSSIPNGKTASSSLPSGKTASSSLPSGENASSSLPSGKTASSSQHSRPKGNHRIIQKVGNFSFAKEQCKEYDADHLVYFDSLEEHKKIIDVLKDNEDLGLAICWWIGLSDEDKDGTWTWVGTKRQPTFTRWGTNQPGNNGQCAAMSTKSGYAWYSESCSSECGAICEKDLPRDQWFDDVL